MTHIVYIDRISEQKQIEKVYKEKALRFLYGDSKVSNFLRPLLLPFVAKWPWFSRIYGYLQKHSTACVKGRKDI